MSHCVRNTIRVVVRRVAGAAVVLVMAACSRAPPGPDWQIQARASLEEFRDLYLQGKPAAAERAYGRALAAISGTGDLAMRERAVLVRCGVAVAAVAFSECPASEGAAVRGSEEKAYATFLSGEWSGLDRAALASAYRAVVTAPSAEGRDTAMLAIEDPVSRLIAAGVLYRRAEISPKGIDGAIATASAQGMRRPLLAWLGIAEQLAIRRGDDAAAKQLRARITFAESGGTDKP
jgi:hypothetical protein